jgi:FkbM family methyltransferase
MEQPLSQRAGHFLRKAGFRRFVVKAAYFVLTVLRKPFVKLRDRTSDAELQKKLANLPRENGHVAIRVLDFTMKVRADDPGLSKELILDGVREQDAVQYLRPHLARCEMIIEIGANQGYYLIQEGLYSPAGARIHAFEPHPQNVATAELNAKLNRIDPKCRLLQAAVSDGVRKGQLSVSSRSNWHKVGGVGGENLEFSGETIEVHMISLDEYCAQVGIDRVDLIRMDVEGHETAVIRGARQTIARSPDLLIFMEFHTSLMRQAGESPERFLEELRDLGLRCVTVCGKSRYLTEPSWEELIQGLELITARYGTHMFFAAKDGRRC